MLVGQIAFWVLAVAAVGSALGVVLFRNAVYSMLSLIANLLTLAFFFLTLDAIFVATIQVLIYAGAVMVLFLFVVTMLSPDAQELERDPIPWQRIVAGVLGVGLVGSLSYLIFTSFANASQVVLVDNGANGLSKHVSQMGDIQAFGQALFHGFLFPFEVTSLLIVIAILGALIFGRRA